MKCIKNRQAESFTSQIVFVLFSIDLFVADVTSKILAVLHKYCTGGYF